MLEVLRNVLLDWDSRQMPKNLLKMAFTGETLQKFRNSRIVSLIGGTAYKIYRRTDLIIERNVIPFKNSIIHRLKYGSAAPERDHLIYIDPSDINYLVVPHFWWSHSRYSTHIEDGDWDRQIASDEAIISARHEGFEKRQLLPINKLKFFRGAKEHFEENIPWNETEFYNSVLNNIENYNGWDRYESPDDFEQTLTDIDELYENMKMNGYQSQTELTTPNLHNGGLDSYLHEVAVDIGREGDLYFDDGRHRFVIARLLGIERIPVRVLVRHTKWQDYRYELAKSNNDQVEHQQIEPNFKHPDLEDITGIKS